MIDIKPRELAILVIGPFNEPFDYLLEDSSHKISIGQIVEVPFGRKQSVGIRRNFYMIDNCDFAQLSLMVGKVK